jgi:alkylation response protein AidB-like acyl-CoA dehydrogenase
MRESRTYGSVRGACSNGRPYRDPSGEWTETVNLTEPQAGSDLAALRTRTVLAHDPLWGEHYRIAVPKIFITYGDHDLAPNIVHIVLVRSPEAPPRSRGISLFLVPKFLPDAEAVSRAGPRVSPRAGSSAAAACCITGSAGTRVFRQFPQPL